MGKVIAGYFICVNGVIWTVFIEDETFSSNMDAGIAVVDSKMVMARRYKSLLMTLVKHWFMKSMYSGHRLWIWPER
ncbi:hypothetical protein CMK12_16845 [Candidatus Poribacteria bacterium]|nr:hypothetical protein [Candidatus Poribacteria bacterium]